MTPIELQMKGWPEMHKGYCPHSRLSSCNPESYRTCSQKLPPWVASRHSLWLVLQWGHTSQSCLGAHDMQRGPKGSNRMWIHPPLTSLPVGERCIKFNLEIRCDVIVTFRGHKQIFFSGHFYCSNFLYVKCSSIRVIAYIRNSRNGYIQSCWNST